MADFPKPLTRLIAAFEAMPGIGSRTAERLALHVIKEPKGAALELADAIREAKATVHYCKRCFNLTQAELCDVCADAKRDQKMVCVVESPRDLVAIERTGAYRGVYHCLLGRLAPLDGVDQSHLTLDALVARCRAGAVREVILATSSDLEGDATALVVARELEAAGVPVSRLARGVPVGYQFDALSGHVLEEAFAGRKPLAATGGAP